jgi:DNA-binding XRE family transcriptional regulator
MRRAAKKERAKADPAASANRRLRLARRLAGFPSTTDAAEATGLKRTTLSAHETGQNAISQKMALLYGAAFGVDARWLSTGALPSGYPADVENRLSKLIETCDQPDRAARETLEDVVSKMAGRVPGRVKPPKRLTQRRQPKTEEVFELSGREIRRCLDKQSFADADPVHLWAFPKGYTADVLGAYHPSAIIVSLENGDRLVVNTSARTPVTGRPFAFVDDKGRLLLDEGSSGPSDPRWVAVGQVCGKIGHFNLKQDEWRRSKA